MKQYENIETGEYVRCKNMTRSEFHVFHQVPDHLMDKRGNKWDRGMSIYHFEDTKHVEWCSIDIFEKEYKTRSKK